MSHARVIILVLTGVFAFVLLLFGYKGVASLSEKTNSAKLITIENRIKNSVKIVSQSYGKMKKETFVFPDDYDKICFIDLSERTFLAQNTDLPEIIKDSVSSGSDQNVFLLGKNRHSFNAGSISLKNPPFFKCFDIIGGSVKLTFEGIGGVASVS